MKNKFLFSVVVALFCFFLNVNSAEAQTKKTPPKKEEKKDVKKDEKKNVTPKKDAKAAGDDKVVGKDEKGRTIYEGPKGGRYYLNDSGNKQYIKK